MVRLTEIFYKSLAMICPYEYDNLCKSKFGDIYDDNVLYFISIQGPTSSGKSSLSNSLKSLLSNRKPYLIRLDDFYLTRDGAYEDVENLDFDNPNILNWKNIYTVINSIIRKDKRIPVYHRSTESCNDLTYVDNIGYNIVIIEGLYAFNCLNDKIFNLKEFDIYDSGKHIENEYIDNEKIIDYKSISNGFKDIKMLNIRLTLCKSKMYSIRTKRDKILRNLSDQIILDRLDKFIWPNTLKWVYSDIFKHDIVIRHGNFNDTDLPKLKNSLGRYFGSIQKSLKHFQDNLREEFLKDCSGECLLE